MALQIFLLLAFQSVYGYVYQQLAILIAMCMAGIAFGSWLGIRRTCSSDSPPYRAIATTQFLLALSAPALILVVSLVAKINGTVTTWLAAQFLSRRRSTFMTAVADQDWEHSMPSICWVDARERLC